MVQVRTRFFGCHYRKLWPGTRTRFDQLMLAKAGVLTGSAHVTGTDKSRR